MVIGKWYKWTNQQVLNNQYYITYLWIYMCLLYEKLLF